MTKCFLITYLLYRHCIMHVKHVVLFMHHLAPLHMVLSSSSARMASGSSTAKRGRTVALTRLVALRRPQPTVAWWGRLHNSVAFIRHSRHRASKHLVSNVVAAEISHPRYPRFKFKHAYSNSHRATYSLEVWRIITGGGGWHHPVHLHLIDAWLLSGDV